ncbi:MAG: hypothetical protein KJ983_00240 [Candidatus Omnitrophica bacterium]|nr:hypothetical protein [Candidatus Omnitrophota bacterium]
MNLRRAITWSMILTGAAAMASQIIFLREFLIVFYGNEISIGIILACWLLWGAFGSWFFGRFSDEIKEKAHVFSSCQIALAFILPLTLIIIRLVKPVMGIATGEIIGYLPMFTAVFVVLSFSCATMGFMFSLACRIYRDRSNLPETALAHIYIVEAIGALIGGFVVSGFMIRVVTPLSILFSLSVLNVVAAIILRSSTKMFSRRRIFSYTSILLLVMLVVGMVLGGVRLLREFSLGQLWKGFNVIESRNSVYGNITVTKKGRETSFYENGLHLYTVPDDFSAEQAVHFALLENTDFSRVLLIGGGIGGLLKEVLKYPVNQVDYVELDSTIIDEAEKHLDPIDSAPLKDARVTIINEDGRFFVKRTNKKYSTVIINLGDPYTIQLNRFYTVGFFQELNRILTDNGIVSFSLTSSDNYIGDELKDYLSSIYISASKVFPDVLLIPGDTVYFLLSNKRNVLTGDPGILMSRLRELGIDAKYVREYYLFDKLSKERLQYVKNVVEKDANAKVNEDFRPVAYYYATLFWGTHFDSPFFRKFLRSVESKNIWTIAILVCLVIVMFGFFDRKKQGKRTVLLSVMTTGFAEIVFQIVVLFSFQVIYGYVFYKLGIILTFFMVGLAFGGWIISRNIQRIRDYMKVFQWTQICICLYPLMLPPLFLWFAKAQSNVVSWTGANLIFPLLPIVAGTIGGIQFPLANKIYLENPENLGRVAGLSYGLDLMGACFGALLSAAFLIPILGIFQTCLLTAVINMSVLVALMLASRKSVSVVNRA